MPGLGVWRRPRDPRGPEPVARSAPKVEGPRPGQAWSPFGSLGRLSAFFEHQTFPGTESERAASQDDLSPTLLRSLLESLRAPVPGAAATAQAVSCSCPDQPGRLSVEGTKPKQFCKPAGTAPCRCFCSRTAALQAHLEFFKPQIHMPQHPHRIGVELWATSRTFAESSATSALAKVASGLVQPTQALC